MILVCGEALIDLVPVVASEGMTYAPRGGGSPYNVAIGLGRLGVPVAFFGRVSVDPFGRLLRDHLIADGVDCSLLRSGDEPTALAVVHLAPGEEPQFVFYGDGAADCMLASDDMPSEATLQRGIHALHFGSISLIREPGATLYERLMERESERRVVSLDPNVRPSVIRDPSSYRERLQRLVALSTIVKVSRADLAWLHPDRDPLDVAADWLTRGPSLVVVTKGEEGATGMTATATIDGPAMAVKVRDTVGAGDAFMAGLLGSLDQLGLLAPEKLTRVALLRCLDFANRAAAIACTDPRAEPPTLLEVDRPAAPRDQ